MATSSKTKKIATPVDERETFVSLQKSFAESGADTAAKLKVLYELQATDIEIGKIMLLRGELPSEVESLENEIAALTGKVAHLTALISGYEANIEASKQEIVDLDNDIQRYKAQIDGGVSNSREYDSIAKEIENQELLKQIAQKNIYETKDVIVERKEDIERLNARIEARNADLEAKKAELDAIVESTATQEAELVARKNALEGKLDTRTVSAYERIRQSTHNHLAVVPVYNGDSCGGCFSTITPQRLIEIASNNKLIICEHCGRIIINPDFE